MIVTKTFRFRLEPNAHHRQLFGRYAGCCRFVYNAALTASTAAYEAEGRTLSFAELSKQLPVLKRAEETAWLAEVNAQVLQPSLKDLEFAYRNFFRRLKNGETPGYPRFKKKGQKDSFRFPQGVKTEKGRAFLPKIGWVRYRDSRPIEGEILQATIKREGEHWFISFACKVELPDVAAVPISEAHAVGIDVGIKSFAVLSDGTQIQNPRILKSALGRLKKDFVHKLSTAIVKNHDVIAVEDLFIPGLIKNRRLSLAISDAGWGQFFRMLDYKAMWAGKHFVRIGRFEASSKKCSECGVSKPMPLSLRTYACGDCGMVMDRDWNASLNIRAAGLAVLNACGGA